MKRKRRKENVKKEKEKVTKSEKDVTPTFVWTPATSGVPGESPLVLTEGRKDGRTIFGQKNHVFWKYFKT